MGEDAFQRVGIDGMDRNGGFGGSHKGIEHSNKAPKRGKDEWPEEYGAGIYKATAPIGLTNH